MVFTSFVLHIFEIIQTQKSKQYTENLIDKLQNSNQNSRLSWVSLIGLRPTRPRSSAFRLDLIYILTLK